jgi:hypothetical protein
VNEKVAVLKGSLDTFHYSGTFYLFWFSSLPAAISFFLMESEKVIEETFLVRQPLFGND